jgi:hypothetical protein
MSIWSLYSLSGFCSEVWKSKGPFSSARFKSFSSKYPLLTSEARILAAYLVVIGCLFLGISHMNDSMSEVSISSTESFLNFLTLSSFDSFLLSLRSSSRSPLYQRPDPPFLIAAFSSCAS